MGDSLNFRLQEAKLVALVRYGEDLTVFPYSLVRSSVRPFVRPSLISIF